MPTYIINSTLTFNTNTFNCSEHGDFPNHDFMKHMEEYHKKIEEHCK